MDFRKDLEGKIQYRELRIDRSSVNQEARTVAVAFSSEEPVERWWGIEVLDHRPECVRMGRLLNGAPLLLGHDTDQQIGVIESAKIDPDKCGRAVVRFSKGALGEEIFSDVADGIRTKVSVGYMVHTLVLEKKVEEVETYRITDWEPFEISCVSVPADDTVGVGRNQPLSHTEHISGGRRMEKDEKTPPAVTQEDVTRAADAAAKAEGERRDAIDAMTSKYGARVSNIQELRKTAIEKKWTVELFRGACADAVMDSKPLDVPDTALGLTDKETRAYSFARAIGAVAGLGVKADFELECSREIAKRMGISPKGILVPYEAQMGPSDDYRKHPDYLQFVRARRDLTVGAPTAGGNLVGTNLLAGSFIELLRNKMLMYRLGARMLSGLVGNVAIPRQTGAGTAVWETEATGITSESAQTVDQVTMSPNEVGAYAEISRKLILQATPGIEGLIQNDLAQTLAIVIDLAILHGSGGTQPTGVVGASGVGSVAGAGLSWDAVLEFWSDVAGANAADGSLAFVTNALIGAMLMGRPKVAGYPDFLLNRDGTMIKYPCEFTEQVSAGYMFFGDWSQILVGEWGVLDITANPFIKDIEGLVRITAHQTVDVAVRHGGAFSVSSTVS